MCKASFSTSRASVSGLKDDLPRPTAPQIKTSPPPTPKKKKNPHRRETESLQEELNRERNLLHVEKHEESLEKQFSLVSSKRRKNAQRQNNFRKAAEQRNAAIKVKLFPRTEERPQITVNMEDCNPL